ncbi:MAG: metal ABC transporter solute-binding protein, Zn/Mn family [Anaerolineaceae bacterium]
MKKIVLTILTLSLLAGCSLVSSPPPKDKLQIAVSVLPQTWFVRELTGDLANVFALVGSGDDAHTYEPSPQQMLSLADADIYFTIGMEFESAWLPKFSNANTAMRVVDSAFGIQLITLGGELEMAGRNTRSSYGHDGLDPHIWYSPARMKQMSQTMAKALITYNPENKTVYEQNLAILLKKIEQVDQKVKERLTGLSKDTFLAAHPAWGYFADAYGLHQLAIEEEGQEPGPETLAALILKARELGIHTIITQKGVDHKLVQSVSGQLGGAEIIELDSLSENWETAMLEAADALAKALK